MARQTIRPYEMGVWGLQDDFIATLSAPNITHKGQVMNPTLTIKDDGTQNLSFSIPSSVKIPEICIMESLTTLTPVVSTSTNSIFII